MTDYIQIDGNIVQDFAQRTLENLTFIEQQFTAYKQDKNRVEVFDVTQLINSLLGLLVFPHEEFYEQRLRKIDIRTLPWAKLEQKPPYKFTELKEFVRMLRNSVSHFQILVGTNHEDDIDQLLFWVEDDNGNQYWTVYMSVSELQQFVKQFANGIVDGSLLNAPRSITT